MPVTNIESPNRNTITCFFQSVTVMHLLYVNIHQSVSEPELARRSSTLNSQLIA